MAAACAAAAVAPGCTDAEPFLEAEAASEVGPAPHALRIDDLTDVPLPPGAAPSGPPSQAGGFSIQTYLVPEQSPAAVLRLYEERLAGADVVSPTQQTGVATLRAVWLLPDGRSLRVSARPQAPAQDAGADVVATLLDLALGPVPGPG